MWRSGVGVGDIEGVLWRMMLRLCRVGAIILLAQAVVPWWNVWPRFEIISCKSSPYYLKFPTSLVFRIFFILSSRRMKDMLLKSEMLSALDLFGLWDQCMKRAPSYSDCWKQTVCGFSKRLGVIAFAYSCMLMKEFFSEFKLALKRLIANGEEIQTKMIRSVTKFFRWTYYYKDSHCSLEIHNLL